MIKQITTFILAVSLAFLPLSAEQSEEQTELKFQKGSIELLDGKLQLDLPEKFKFLDAKQSQFVLEKLWGNPPDDTIEGMIFLSDESPLGENTYAVTIEYSEEGYVKDDDAESIDYNELLKEMQEDAEEANEYRKEEGYPQVTLVGWASEPYYDSETKKLHWAKNLKFDGTETNVLNYNLRILGRKGVLVLNIISEMSTLERVKKDIPDILASADFTEGNRYEDFDSSIDKIAAFGLTGLIAGKVLAKAGFLAKFWKLIAFAFVGAAGFIKKLFGSKSEE